MESTSQTSGNKSETLHEERLNGALNGRNEELRRLLSALQAMRAGDFSVRLPNDWSDLAGKVATLFNEIAAVNQRMAYSLFVVTDSIGRCRTSTRRSARVPVV